MKILKLFFLLILSATALRAANLYVGEDGRSRIGKYTTSGAVVNASLINGVINTRDINVDPFGNLLVVAAGVMYRVPLGFIRHQARL